MPEEEAEGETDLVEEEEEEEVLVEDLPPKMNRIPINHPPLQPLYRKETIIAAEAEEVNKGTFITRATSRTKTNSTTTEVKATDTCYKTLYATCVTPLDISPETVGVCHLRIKVSNLSKVHPLLDSNYCSR